jgi:hypothetical protein
VIFRNRKYETLLENELARVQAENRALLNSLLTYAGMPPVEGTPLAEQKVSTPTKQRTNWRGIGRMMRKKSSEGTYVLDMIGGKDVKQPNADSVGQAASNGTDRAAGQ